MARAALSSVMQTVLYYGRKRRRARQPEPVNPALTDAPELAGDATVGEELTLTPGVWEDDPTVTVKWFRDGVVIPGAAGNAYTTVEADVGATIWANETARTSTGTSSASSNKIGPISEG